MKEHYRGRCTGLILIVMLAGRCASPVSATQSDAERARGISVLGTGEVRAKPNLVEIDLKAAAAAELSGDAIVKYRDTKRRMVQALESLKLKNFQISERGISLTNATDTTQMQQLLMRGQPVPEKAQLQVSRLLRVSVSDIQNLPEEELMEMLGKIFDVAKDAGMAGAAPSFVLDKLTELREQAYQKAVEDARARAQRLAHLTGLKLGPVAWVQELQVSGDDVSPGYSQPYAGYSTLSDTSGPRVTSPQFAEIPIRVKLQIRFDVAKPESETAQR
jgi:uncharacterized protein YggE